MTKSTIIVGSGWMFRDYRNFKKYSGIIRRYFEPKLPYKENIENILLRCRNNKSSVLVGVHIRKGDYRRWSDGKYYYSDHVYRDKMFQLRDYLATKKKEISFLICSDEAINTDCYKDLNVNLSSNQFVEDLYALAECDFIIGPPSSYSSWASFYGKVPLLYIKDPDQKILMEKFRVYCG